MLQASPSARSRNAAIRWLMVSSTSPRTLMVSCPDLRAAKWPSSLADQAAHLSTSQVRSATDKGRCGDWINAEQPWRDSEMRSARSAELSGAG